MPDNGGSAAAAAPAQEAAPEAETLEPLTDEPAELSKVLTTTYNCLISGLHDDAQRKCDRAFAELHQDISNTEHVATHFAKQCADSTRLLLKKEGEIVGSLNLAIKLLRMYMPFVLVYVGMGYTHSRSLTAEQRKVTAKLFAGSKSFNNFVLKRLKDATNIEYKGR